jgi:hypothetical protein
MTADEVAAFQARPALVDGELAPPCDWRGIPLRVDGDLGPKTRWALAISKLAPRRQAIVKRACSKVGEAETPGVANRGAWPDFVLRRCGIYVPDDDPLKPMPDNAWCAAHASWCMSVEGLPERKDAGARSLAQALWRTRFALPGDFGWFPTGSWQAHIFPIIGVSHTEVACAEGNHGNRVALVRRSLGEINLASPIPPEELALIPPGLELVPVRAAGTR